MSEIDEICKQINFLSQKLQEKIANYAQLPSNNIVLCPGSNYHITSIIDLSLLERKLRMFECVQSGFWYVNLYNNLPQIGTVAFPKEILRKLSNMLW